MNRQMRRKSQQDRGWIKDVPAWLTGVAAVAAVLTTAVFGLIELTDRTDPSATPTADVARTSPSPGAPASPMAGATAPPAAGGGAPPADMGNAGTIGPPDVKVTGMGWQDDAFHVEGTVSGLSGPLWVAVQPGDPGQESGWSAVPMQFQLPDDIVSLTDWRAVFRDLTRADYCRVKVFQESYGFGAGGAPGVQDFGDYLEREGAMLPSEILDEEVIVED